MNEFAKEFIKSAFQKACRPPAAAASPLSNVPPGLLPQNIDKPYRTTRVVLVNGCFDLFHPGHAATLMYARKVRPFGGRPFLVAAVNSDASVARLKGSDRPYQPFDHRAGVVAAVRGVDLVVGFEDDTPERLIKALRPDVLVKGVEYHGQVVPGEKFVVENGGFVLYAPKVEGYSTTLQAEKLGFKPARKPALVAFANSYGPVVFDDIDEFSALMATRPGFEYGRHLTILSWLTERGAVEVADGYAVVVNREAFDAAVRAYLSRRAAGQYPPADRHTGP